MVRNVFENPDGLVLFYEDGYLVGAVNYKNKSQHYIDDAIDNWMDGIMTVETVEKYSAWHYVNNVESCL